MNGISPPADLRTRPLRGRLSVWGELIMPVDGRLSIAVRTAVIFVPSLILTTAGLVVGQWFLTGLVAAGSAFFAYHWHRRVRSDRVIRDLNARLESDNRALEAVNGELETFSYSVSHDLRTPLRSIDGFCQALAEDYATQFDDTGRDHLNRVRRAAQRMGELIDDLLNLSRVSRAVLNVRSIDIGAIAAAAADEVAALDTEREVDWQIAGDLIVEADPKLVRVALNNLIGNAFKFTARAERARIAFGTAETDQGRVFYVADNGAGFDMAYADKLFGAFQRLHSSEDYPGTGIGLATVQRVINKHGGRIWVDAKPGDGATFYFTLGTQAP